MTPSAALPVVMDATCGLTPDAQGDDGAAARSQNKHRRDWRRPRRNWPCRPTVQAPAQTAGSGTGSLALQVQPARLWSDWRNRNHQASGRPTKVNWCDGLKLALTGWHGSAGRGHGATGATGATGPLVRREPSGPIDHQVDRRQG